MCESVLQRSDRRHVAPAKTNFVHTKGRHLPFPSFPVLQPGYTPLPRPLYSPQCDLLAPAGSDSAGLTPVRSDCRGAEGAAI